MRKLESTDLIPKEFNYQGYLIEHGIPALFNEEINENTDFSTKVQKSPMEAVDAANTRPLPPEYDDLVRLHYLCISRRCLTVLEFGIGKSTAVLASALSLNKQKDAGWAANNLRTANPHELHCVDNYQNWINQVSSSLPKSIADQAICHFYCARLSMSTFEDRVCTYYDPLPNVSPDLIYLDGPDQYSAFGDIRGLTTKHSDRMAMSADILAMEHFLQPGTLIIVDGRTANARFLACNLQRQWGYYHSEQWDHHFFELQEPPLGKWNRKKIDHCLGEDFYARLARES